MGNTDYSRLRFRRQYIITNQEKEVPFIHESVKLTGNYILKKHPDLVYTELEQNNRKMILLGDIYDYRSPGKSNQEILQDFLKESFDNLLIKIAEYAGRYVIIHIEGENFRMLHDASGARKIYYTYCSGEGIYASSPFLISEHLDLEPTKDSSKLEYYQSERFVSNLYSNIGDTTYFDEIFQLLPNHYLDINKKTKKRFWPYKAYEILSREEIVKECAGMIEGFMKGVSNRYPLMMGVTAGYDSRLLMAATKNLDQEVLFYLNITKELEDSLDRKIHEKIFSGEKIPSTFFRFEEKADEEFRKIYFENNPLAHPDFVDIYYNYLHNYQNRVNLPGGVITVAKSVYHPPTDDIDGKFLARMQGFEQFSYAIKYYEQWSRESADICKQTNTNIHELNYHENIHTNAGTQLQLDKDMVQEEFIVFNSAHLIARMLTYDYEQRKKPIYRLHTDLIKYFWPELMKYPLNPSFKNRVKDLLYSLHIYEPVLKLKKLIKH